MALSAEYAKNISYLQNLSAKGALNSDNSILKMMQGKTNVGEVRAALSTLNINPV